MTIEEILDTLNRRNISGVVILRANEGYSAIPIRKPEYTREFLRRGHFNGETVLDAMGELKKVLIGR